MSSSTPALLNGSIAKDLIALHRKQTDFRINGESIDLLSCQQLIIPNHFFEHKGNLLPGFEPHDVRNFLRVNGGGLKKRTKPLCPGTEMATLCPFTSLRKGIAPRPRGLIVWDQLRRAD